ncbi:MAG: sulfur oxidation c-type cytochrome SoxX [Hyphomicrobiales bacterium]|nr:sulfur oxidation c-type cytochrome SoxX [Hyphomicrobiales bacterium]MDE2114550.1 sulfur oxidation c-type cytochrome SoxX [Hyphomicrobiales bacterium]
MVAALALSGSTALAAVTAATPAATPVAAPADAPIVLKVVDGGIPVSLTGKPGDAVTGKSVFMDRGLGNCYACHTVSLLKDQPFPGEIGPTLDGVGTLLTVPQLRMVVSNAKLMFPDTIMPAFHKNADLKDVADKFKGKPMLTSQQVEDVVAFLATLK